MKTLVCASILLLGSSCAFSQDSHSHATGKPVTLVTDAIRSLREEDGARTIQAFTAAGGKLATSSKLLPMS